MEPQADWVDPEGFYIAEPRVLLGAGERAKVFGALQWVPDASEDRLMDAWYPNEERGASRETIRSGFTEGQLCRAHRALRERLDQWDEDAKTAPLPSASGRAEISWGLVTVSYALSVLRLVVHNDAPHLGEDY